ncbi:PAS domain S-box-containing protein/diguanylate cyclase (GGDEF) domain-containing protein [Luteibacter sp. UNC138MFCol5.1]|uniref:EAL domain-containing response regulator n=1 Tax=Luteibacter sp. UNC138MFCol5.1 TaxID=1502774 RepID=UPI0008B96470|nr:EAL domain-containing protein [Luteibacter sp. UNC138MFCol5.1]SEO60407.1 PAS domain S-box-containing protein/diguanylate cyclase (GGDEF) domain-containing protein [Luteibacter sp. UNC138MFCol5.1]
MKHDNVIRILFIENSVEDAELLINVLRNGGIAVRPARATTPDDIQAALDESIPDLVLMNPGVPGIDTTTTMRQLDASGRDLAMIAVVDSLDDDTIADLFAAGARGVALRKRSDQVLAVVQREFEALSTRRQVRRLETALRETERRCDALLDSSRDAIAYVHEGMHVRVNQAYLEAFGFAEFDDIIGLPILDLVAGTHADDFKNTLRGLSKGDRIPPPMELLARRDDGGTFKASVEFAHATFEGEACLQIVFRQQMVDAALVAQLQRDPVTGLYNRSRTLECIDEAVAAAAAGRAGQAVLLVEPDNWKEIVASAGIGNADHLLAALAAKVTESIDPDEDVAGVLGDHTLGLILSPRGDLEHAALTERLRTTIAETIFDAGSRSLTVTITIGGTLIAEKNANTEAVLDQASACLRAAQNQGGNRVELHDPSAREKADAEREQYWLDLVREALAQDGLRLYHQQIISLQDAAGEFYEILVRMRGPKGDVLPSYFFPVAERNGLLPAIDRWVLGHAIDALAHRENDGLTTTYFVKMTLQSLEDPELLPWLVRRLESAKLRRSRLVIEMPESKVLTSLRPTQEFVAGWRKAGGGFAIEQFGSGLNSFQMLNHVEADFLKIDRSFMTDLPQHPENQKRIAEICKEGHASGKQTVAEWVEDAVSTSLLFAAGVDFIQGNFLQEPAKVLAEEYMPV